jgi:hypothetical protein
VPARLAAVELLAVDRADEVDHEEVAVVGRALHGLERRERLAQALQLGLNLLRVDRRVAPADLQALVLPELRGRHDAYLDRESERQPRLGQVGQVELRVADGGDAGVGQRLLVPARQPAPHGLVHDGLAADLAQHDLGRHLALAKARHPHLAAELRGRAAHLALEGLAGHLDLDAHARVPEVGGLGRQGCRHGAADDTLHTRESP